MSQFLKVAKNIKWSPFADQRSSVLGLVVAVLVAPGTTWAQYTYVTTSGTSGNWNVAARWTGGPVDTFPNAIDASVTLILPLQTAPSANYNLQLSATPDQGITIGSLTVNNNAVSAFNTRIGGNGNGTLTFQATSGTASWTENAGTPDSTVATRIFAPVVFASDTVITQNHAITTNVGAAFDTGTNSAGGQRYHRHQGGARQLGIQRGADRARDRFSRLVGDQRRRGTDYQQRVCQCRGSHGQ